MFYKTSHYLIYTTKTIPCSHKKKLTQVPIIKRKKKLSKKKSHYTHESRMMTLLYILYKCISCTVYSKLIDFCESDLQPLKRLA